MTARKGWRTGKEPEDWLMGLDDAIQTRRAGELGKRESAGTMKKYWRYGVRPPVIENAESNRFISFEEGFARIGTYVQSQPEKK